MSIWLASTNKNKKEELSACFKKEILLPSDFRIKYNPEETGTSFFENSLLKAKFLYNILEEKKPKNYKTGDYIIADDSGLCVDALEGRPGIHSARYTGKYKNDTGKLTDNDRSILLLAEMDGVKNRVARFVCAMILFKSPDNFYLVQETLEGEIIKNIKDAAGINGFGFDPIFYLPGSGRTAAQLSVEEKNKISHRGKAASALLGFL